MLVISVAQKHASQGYSYAPLGFLLLQPILAIHLTIFIVTVINHAICVN
jgi:hypothetical protein